MVDEIARAVAALRRGEVIVYPTDTLWGLGADATNARAVERLIALKARPDHQPISVAVSSNEEIEPLADLTPERRSYLRTHLPGPFTVLLPPSPAARRTLVPAVAGDHPTIGIRVPDHPLARALARSLGRPLTATSANRHGTPPARTLAEARRAFGTEVGRYVPADPPPSGAPSTLVDLTGSRVRERPRR